MKRMLVLLLVVALAGCGGRGGASSESEARGARTPIEVHVAASSAAVLEVSATGTVAARLDIPLSSEASGQVRDVPVRVGDRVREGDVLVKLDDELAALGVRQADAQLLLAEADLDNAEAAFRRTSELWKKGDVSDSDYEAVERGAKAARAGHMAALAARSSAGRQLRNTEIVSPIDGVVAFVHVKVGHLIGVGTPVAHVVNDDVVEVEVGLNENQVVDVRAGSRATLKVRAYPGETFGAEVEYVGPKADDLTRTYPVRVVAPNSKGLLRSGMVAEVTLRAREFDDVIVIERDWVVERFGELSVFVVADSVAVVRKVRLGRVIGDEVIVTSGLEPGDGVVSFGYDRLTDGALVDVRQPGR
ncbi:MAG: efflux RND transporter periplasmic adaptor subunit [Candidatus Eisenbacteria bacterium]